MKPRRTPPAFDRIRADRMPQEAAKAKGQAIEAWRSHRILEHGPVMPIPIALKPLAWVESTLELQKFRQLRIAGLDLLAAGPLVVGQKITAAPFPGQVDQTAERVRGLLNSLRRMRHVQIQDGTGPWLLRPGEKRLVVPLDQADRPVDHLHHVRPKIFPHVFEERSQFGPGNVEL